jgi:hypothetical protein
MLQHDHADSASAARRPSWQFGLHHLFALTTLAALAAGLAVTIGPRTLMTSAGILLAWLNLCGAFHEVQHGRRQAALLWAAWAVFLVSLALPCMHGFGSSSIYGWTAAWFALTAPLYAMQNEAFFQASTPLFFAISTANGLALCLPLLIWQLRRGQGAALGTALCLTMVSTWVMWDAPMLLGYYVWCGSFFLAMAAIPIHRRVFAAMVGIAILAIAALSLDKP